MKANKESSSQSTIRKKKNPRFLRQDAINLKNLKMVWRKPRGIHSKIRMSIKGHRPMVRIGYRNAVEIRDTHNGMKIIRIKNLKDMEKAAKDNLIIISSTLGFKKKKITMEKAKELGIKILNIKHPDEYIEKNKKKMHKKESQKTVLPEQKKNVAHKEHEVRELSEQEAEEKKAEEKRKVLEKAR